MCIRDRAQAINFGDVRIQGLEFSLDAPLVTPYGVWSFNGSGAVSYTPLRAHETVLDLVCRLLLEKKKTRQKKNKIKLLSSSINTLPIDKRHS